MKKMLKLTITTVTMSLIIILIKMTMIGKTTGEIDIYDQSGSGSSSIDIVTTSDATEETPYIEASAIVETELATNEMTVSENSQNKKINSIDGIITYAEKGYSSTRMSYMDYMTITDETSEQYRLQQYAHTDINTGIRMVGNRFCIAIGQEYTNEKGRYIDVVLKNGVRIPCILADCKAYCDTINEKGLVGADGGIVEFVVDTSYLPEMVQLMGSNEYQFDGLWQSPVAYVVVYDNKFVFD